MWHKTLLFFNLFLLWNLCALGGLFPIDPSHLMREENCTAVSALHATVTSGEGGDIPIDCYW
jgi:hypothetical protein